MEAIADSIESLAAGATEARRRSLMTQLRKLADSLEDPNDTVHRLGYLTAAAKIGFDVGLFTDLVAAEGPLGVEQVARKTGGDEHFFGRYLSYLASINLINEVARGQYEANDVTRNLAQKVTVAGISHCFVTIGPQYQALPGYMKKTGYRSPDDGTRTVFQDAWHTSETAFSWFAGHPEALGFFNDYMAFRREPRLSWLSVYPVADETCGWDAAAAPTMPDESCISDSISGVSSSDSFDAASNGTSGDSLGDTSGHSSDATSDCTYDCTSCNTSHENRAPETRAIYVNIGGGIGHQCAQFRDRFPSLPGRVVLQDLPHSIARALPTPGVENMAHDFFGPQPVRAAKFYFSRGVLHNHPDGRVAALLGRTRDAMAPDSVALLDEMVLPEQGVGSYAAAMDLTMMCALAARERSEAQWRAVIEGAGLRLVRTYWYNPASYEAVMDVRLP